jgi:hypothetical protein
MELRFAAVSALCIATAVPVQAGTPATNPIRILVRADSSAPVADTERKAREDETNLAVKRAEQERKAVEKALSAAHGKKTARWPADANSRFEAAWQAELMARMAHHAIKTEPKARGGVAANIAGYLNEQAKKSPGVTVTESTEEADLTVDVMALRAKTSFPAAAFIVYLKVTPGALVPRERFAGTSFGQVRTKDAYLGQILGVQSLAGFISTAHAYSEAEPYWIIEVFQQGTSYLAPAQTAAEAIAGFATALSPDGAAVP